MAASSRGYGREKMVVSSVEDGAWTLIPGSSPVVDVHWFGKMPCHAAMLDYHLRMHRDSLFARLLAQNAMPVYLPWYCAVKAETKS